MRISQWSFCSLMTVLPRGRRLFFGLGTDGRTVELSGEAPFNVLFGNADYVSVRVNGAERAISAAERRGNTARLTIAGS